MFEWDETVAFHREAGMIERIRSIRQEEVQPEGLPKPHWQYKELCENEKAEMLAPRWTFNHAIDVKDEATSPLGPIYPMLAYQLEELKQYRYKMLAEGKIADHKSPASATILFVPKPDGRLRLCVDYHHLNKLTILNKYPLPLMTELRERVAGASIFTKLDLKDCYHLIQIKKGGESTTAFRTRYGCY